MRRLCELRGDARVSAMTQERIAKVQEDASVSAMTPGPTHPNVVARQYRTLNPHATGTRVPDTILCDAVGEWRESTTDESKAQDPLVEAQEVVRARGHCLSIPQGRAVLRGRQLSVTDQRASSAQKCLHHVTAHSDTTHSTHRDSREIALGISTGPLELSRADGGPWRCMAPELFIVI